MFWNVFIHIIIVDTYFYTPQFFLAGYMVRIYTQFFYFFWNVFVGMQIFSHSPEMLALCEIFTNCSACTLKASSITVRKDPILSSCDSCKCWGRCGWTSTEAKRGDTNNSYPSIDHGSQRAYN